MKYSVPVVLAYFRECKLPPPTIEYPFAKEAMGRKWRLDFVFLEAKLGVEVQGGLFSGGRHVRGAALVGEHEKLNALAELGYRVIFVQPRDLCTLDTVNLIRRCLGIPT